jgi:hypothetical protein
VRRDSQPLSATTLRLMRPATAIVIAVLLLVLAVVGGAQVYMILNS